MSDTHRDLWVPRVGEAWAPALPWPEDRPPEGFALLRLADRHVEPDRYVYGVRDVHCGRMVVRACVDPEASVREAWEFRYGDAVDDLGEWERTGDPWLRSSGGRRVTVHLGDIRRGFVRVGGAA